MTSRSTQFIVGLLGLSTAAFCQPGQSQPCDCPKAFDFVVKTIETNYAGWSDKVTPRNRAAVDQLTRQLRAKTAGATEAQCFGLLARWTESFKDHHTGIYLTNTPTTPYTEKDTAKIRADFASWDKLPLNEAAAKRYLDQNVNALNPIEGIWRADDGSYTVAIVASKTPTRQFAGAVLKGDGVYWQPGQVKMEWSVVDRGAYGGTYFMRDHSPTVRYAELKEGALAISGQGNWIRVYPASNAKPTASLNWNRDYADKFELKPVGDSTMLLTLPDFDISHKPTIDSLLMANREQLLQTPYFILDVRNNGGGWDSAYERILDYLYTNPIISINSNLLVTKENLGKWEGHYTDPNTPATTKAEIGEMITRMKKLPMGQFLKRSNDTTTRPAVYPMPRRIAVLIGRGCGSSGEEFVLAARQSKKVVVLGENTAGVLDYANVHELSVPGSRFNVYYATSRTNRRQLIDNIGIAPDVRIPATETNWIKYAQTYLQNEKTNR